MSAVHFEIRGEHADKTYTVTHDGEKLVTKSEPEAMDRIRTIIRANREREARRQTA